MGRLPRVVQLAVPHVLLTVLAVPHVLLTVPRVQKAVGEDGPLPEGGRPEDAACYCHRLTGQAFLYGVCLYPLCLFMALSKSYNNNNNIEQKQYI